MRRLRGDAHDLLQGECFRAAQLVALVTGGASGQRLGEGGGDIADVDGREARAGARQRQHPGAQAQQRGKAIGQRIARPENHRRLEDGPVEGRAGGAYQSFGLAFGAQVVTRAALGIGIECAHVQQPRHARLRHRVQQPRGEFDVRTAKSGAAKAALVEDPTNIDDGIGAVDAAAKEVRVVDVADRELDARQRHQIESVASGTRQHAQLVAGAGEAIDQLLADEAGAAGDTDAARPLDHGDRGAHGMKGGAMRYCMVRSTA